MRRCGGSVITPLVLVCAVFIGHVHAKCDFTSSDNNVIYVSVSDAVLVGRDYLTEPPSHLNDINKPCANDDAAPDIPCCVSDDNNEYIFLSLDDVFGLIQEGYFNSSLGSNFVVALMHSRESSYQFSLQTSHSISKISSFLLQSFPHTNQQAIITCSDNVKIELMSICSVTLREVTFNNCGTADREGVELRDIDSVTVSNVIVNGSATSGIEISMFSRSNLCTNISQLVEYSIIDSMFINNGRLGLNGGVFHRSVYGGGLHLVIDRVGVRTTISNTKFVNNVGTYGGGLRYYAVQKESQLQILNCTFEGNRATVHSGAAYLTGGMNYSTYGHVLVSNSSFENNTADDRFFYSDTPCSIYVTDALFVNISDSVFLNNPASALCVQSASVKLSGEVVFSENNGYRGGAINAQLSEIRIDSNAHILFSCNHAVEGGAIYSDYSSISTDKCLFHFPSDNSYNITFSRNSAIASGDSIYFRRPNQICRDDIRRLGIPAIATGSGFMSTTFNVHKSFGNNTSTDSYCSEICRTEMILGQFLAFNVTVRNFFDVPSFIQVNLKLKKISTKRELLCSTADEYPHKLQGPTHINLENGVNELNVFINGPEIVDIGIGENHTLSVIDTSDEVINEMLISILPCPLGFIYNDTLRQCECIDSKYLVCDISKATACISVGHWLGRVSGIKNHSIASCASIYCKSNIGLCDNCPFGDEDDYCLLPRKTSEQCLSNRDGVLCSECIFDHALTFGGIKCVSDETCDQGIGLVPATLNIIFLIFTIVILIVMLKFNDKLTTGYLYCFIFYFSIVRHFVFESIVGNGVLLYISIPASFTQLNPQFLGYMPICFSKTLTALQQQVFLYLNPLIISTFVLLVVGVSRRFPKIKFADNTMVKAICLLVLLSFTALTETSFNILNPVQFSNLDTVLVNLQPSTEYLDVRDHLPYFILAMLVFLLLVIPFTLLLLFAPLLNKCFNLNKIKPFLDEFQGCYKDRFRWMAGYYFLARFIYLLYLTSPTFMPETQQYGLQLLTVLLLVVHLFFQPYASTWLNLADSVLLVDLLLMTLLFGNTAKIAFEEVSGDFRVAIVCVLVTIPILYLLLVVAVTIGGKYLNKRGSHYVSKRFIRPLSNDGGRRHSTTAVSYSMKPPRSNSTSTELRESLLDDIDEEEESYVRISKSKPSRRSKKMLSGIVDYTTSIFEIGSDETNIDKITSSTVSAESFIEMKSD